MREPKHPWTRPSGGRPGSSSALACRPAFPPPTCFRGHPRIRGPSRQCRRAGCRPPFFPARRPFRGPRSARGRRGGARCRPAGHGARRGAHPGGHGQAGARPVGNLARPGGIGGPSSSPPPPHRPPPPPPPPPPPTPGRGLREWHPGACNRIFSRSSAVTDPHFSMRRIATEGRLAAFLAASRIQGIGMFRSRHASTPPHSRRAYRDRYSDSYVLSALPSSVDWAERPARITMRCRPSDSGMP